MFSSLLRQIALATVCWGLIQSAAPASQPLEPQPGILVLRSGSTLEGRVIRVGDRYVVALSHGEIRIPVADVEMFCRDLQELYFRRRMALPADDAAARLRLALWCIKHQMLSEAESLLQAAADIDPFEPGIGAVNRRLGSAQKPATSAPSGRPKQAPRPVVESAIPSDVGPDIVQQFTQSVQPLLLNRCGSKRCHGATAGAAVGFRLIRPRLGAGMPAQWTRRNLSQVLQVTDRHAPSASRLLTAPQQAHGGLRTSVFSPSEQRQLDVLSEWVARLAARDPGQLPNLAADRTEPILSQRPPGAEPSAELSANAPAKIRTAGFSEPVGDPDGGDNPVRQTRFRPRDDFDPEVFNRRYQLPPMPTATQTIDAPPAAGPPRNSSASPAGGPISGPAATAPGVIRPPAVGNQQPPAGDIPQRAGFSGALPLRPPAKAPPPVQSPSPVKRQLPR